MSEVVINPDTGLPVLPEGQYWKVFERSNRDPYGFSRRNYYEVTHAVGIFTTERIEMVAPPFWFWQKPVITFEDKEKEIVSRAIFQKAGEFTSTDKEAEQKATALLTEQVGDGWEIRTTTDYGFKTYTVLNLAFNEASIQQVAIAITKWQEKERVAQEKYNAEQARKARLVGTYPPKKLEV